MNTRALEFLANLRRTPRAAAVSAATLVALYGGSCTYLRQHPPPAARAPAHSSRQPARSLAAAKTGRPSRPSRPRITTAPAQTAAAAADDDEAFAGAVRRRPVGRVEARMINVTYDSFQPVVGVGYWERRLDREATVLMDADTAARFRDDAEEAAAARGLAGEIFTGRLPPGCYAIRAPGDVWGRIYAVALKPAAAAAAHKPELTIHFHGEVDRLDVVDLAQVTAGPPATSDGPYWTQTAAPGAAPRDLLAELPDLRRRLLIWLGGLPAGPFARVASFDGKQCLAVIGVRDAAGAVAGLTVCDLGPRPPRTFDPPPGYRARGAIDYELERVGAAAASAPRVPRVRRIDGLERLSPAERLAAKATIVAYAEAGTRDAQVHAVINPSATARAAVGLRFQSAGDETDVIVDGPFAAPPDLRRAAGPAAVADYYAARVPGAAAGGLRAAWDRRHPATPIPPACADDDAAARQWIARQLGGGGGGLTAAWFADNYGIVVAPDAAAVTARLRGQGFDGADLDGLRPPGAYDLLMLELALQRIDAALLPTFRGAWVAGRDDQRTAAAAPHEAHEAGKTYSFDAEHTVVINDSAYGNQASTFVGDAACVYNPALGVVLHELGHVVGNQQGVQAAFNARFRAAPVGRLTWYAASEPETELFPEVFAWHYGAPAWFAENHPDVALWMAGLGTRAAPAKK